MSLDSDLGRLIADARSQAEAVASQPSMPIDAIPGYELIREIHRGGQGVVYLALQRATRRHVAIKVLKEGPFAGHGEKARFEREVQILAFLKHPQIVAIHDSGCAHGNFYFVMDYIEGVPLDEWADRCRQASSLTQGTHKGKYPSRGHQDRFVRLFVKICDALHVAHQRGIIHRDLKPTNIRVAESDEPFVLDFGLAKWNTEGNDLTAVASMTRTGQFLGTLPWASPEQVEAATYHADVRTDIYAVGLMLYRAITGKMPYALESSIAEMIRVIVQVEPSSPRSTVQDLDVDLETIILKCLRKDPDRRYQSIAALSEDLKRYLVHEPIDARKESGWYLLKMFARKHRTVVALSAGLALLLFSASLSLTYLYALAKKNEKLALTRAEEVKQIADFQAAQLSNVDTARMGSQLRDQLLKNTIAESHQAESGSLVDPDHFYRRVNFTDLALQALDENIFKQGIETIHANFKEQPVVRATLLQSAAVTMRRLGLLDRALEPQKEAYELRRTTLGETHNDTLVSLSDLGLLQWSRGELALAESHLRQAYDLQSRVYGSDHPQTLAAEHNLGGLLQAAEKRDEALQHTQHALDIRRHVLGAEHPDTLKTLSDLGSIYFRNGNLNDANLTFREALGATERNFGKDHDETLALMNNLAHVLQAQGQWDEAQTYFRQVLEARRMKWGDRHPSTLNSMSSLAGSLTVSGKLKEALPLHEEALQAYRSNLGELHPHTLRSMNAMSSGYLATGDFASAMPIAEESLQLHRAVLGNDHPETIKAMRQLGQLWQRTAKYSEAIALRREALQASQKVNGETHPETIESEFDLAKALRAAGDIDEAMPHMQRALEANRRGLGEEHPRTLSTMAECAGILISQEKFAEALPLFQEAFVGFEKTVGKDHPNTLGALLGMGLVFKEERKWDQAMSHYQKALAGYQDALGAMHPFTLRALNLLGELELAQQHYEPAISIFRDALSKGDQTVGLDHPESLRSQINLGHSLWLNGDHDEAGQFLDAAKATVESLPPRHELRKRYQNATLAVSIDGKP